MITLAEPSTLDSVLHRLSSLTPEARACWGKMNANQMVCHLADSFSAVMGKKQVAPASNFLSRWIIKPIALYAPMQWPHNVKTRPEVEQGVGGTPPSGFDGDRLRLIKSLRDFAGSRAYQGHSHPMFGKLSDREWLRWGYLHTDHHLRQFGL